MPRLDLGISWWRLICGTQLEVLAHNGLWGDLDWTPTGIDQQRLRHAEASSFPRMDTDFRRMNTDKLNFEHIRDVRSAQRASYPCPSVRNPCPSVENPKVLETRGASP